MRRLELIGLRLPTIKKGDNIVELLLKACAREGIELRDYDVIAITSKILSKSLGLLYNLNHIEPGKTARKLSKKTGVDPRFLEILLRESDELIAAVPIKELVNEGIVAPEVLSKNKTRLFKILNQFPTIFITKRDGQLWSDSGLDSSNNPPGIVSVPPRNLDLLAEKISKTIKERIGVKVGVVICDTEILPGGPIDIARGSHGVPVSLQKFGEPDAYGKPKFGGSDNIANAICAAAGLIMGQLDEGIPIVIVRGLVYEWSIHGVKWLSNAIDTETAVRKTIMHTLRVFGPLHALKLLVKSQKG